MVARQDISHEILVARHKFLVAPGRQAGDFARPVVIVYVPLHDNFLDYNNVHIKCI